MSQDTQTPEPLVPLAVLREKLGVAEDELSDAMLTIYLAAAVRHVETVTGRVLVPDAMPVEDHPPNVLLWEGDTVLAIILLVQAFDRDDPIPAAVSALIGPKRWFSL